MERFGFTDSEGVFIRCYKWLPDTKPVAVVQIVHGMMEHARKYSAFAEFLNSHSIAVYAHDHRGHGETIVDNDFGYYGKGGFNLAVENTYEVTKIIKSDFPELPNYIFAHSMGSFVTQRFIQNYGKEIHKCILCGSDGPDFLYFLGRVVAKIITFFRGDRHYSKFLDKMAFGSYNKKTKNATNKDWLTRDDSKVDKYVNDPLCGKTVTASFFYELSKGMDQNFYKKNLKKIPKELPVFIISGDMDPVGKYGKGVLKLFDVYQKLGLKNVKMKLYEGARHELINEINKEEIMKDIYDFLLS
ncbi:MAG: lysophospholipase [Clostridia bacterium]|nr:lysophospholipase [Clostridia bacterium]